MKKQVADRASFAKADHTADLRPCTPEENRHDALWNLKGGPVLCSKEGERESHVSFGKGTAHAPHADCI